MSGFEKYKKILKEEEENVNNRIGCRLDENILIKMEQNQNNEIKIQKNKITPSRKLIR